jgi:hypothetical protein
MCYPIGTIKEPRKKKKRDRGELGSSPPLLMIHFISVLEFEISFSFKGEFDVGIGKEGISDFWDRGGVGGWKQSGLAVLLEALLGHLPPRVGEPFPPYLYARSATPSLGRPCTGPR